MVDGHPSLPPSTGSLSNSKASGGPATNPRFLTLTQETALSTRGQNLTHLIQNRSSSSLVDLRKNAIARAIREESANDGLSGSLDSFPDMDLGRSATRDSGYWMHDGPEGTTFGLDGQIPLPPPGFPLTRHGSVIAMERDSPRRMSFVPRTLMTSQVRSQRLIGNSNPRYQWERYYKSEEELTTMKKSLRKYYERNNYLIQQYLYIDRLLDSSLPHDLIQEYAHSEINIPPTIQENGSPEEPDSPDTPATNGAPIKVKRTPKDLYKVPDNEETPLLSREEANDAEPVSEIPLFRPEEENESGERIVTVAIYVNLVANTVLLILKIIVMALTDSLSVLASLVDAVLDFLSTAIVWTTTRLISSADGDTQNFPVGNRRLEPLGVLVFSVIMMTSFFQVALEAFNKLTSKDHEIVELGTPAIVIMAVTVGVKGACWLWCRLIHNSSVQALAQDALTDVVFNTFSIIFPLLGFFLKVWWLDPLGGLLLSLYVIISWAITSRQHILNLTGRAAGKDERNILLYLTMRFAHTIRYIQGIAAYHAGDKLNVEVDIVLDETMSLRDSHDLGESLQYVLESVPGVERAFVHADYRPVNLPSHMRQ